MSQQIRYKIYSTVYQEEIGAPSANNLYTVCCILGWVDVGTIAHEYGEIFLDFMKKYGKLQKKRFLVK
jgi:hypothetical protein